MKRLLILALLFGCHKEPPPKPVTPAVNVDAQSVITVGQRYLTAGPRLAGTLQPQRSATIVAETGGTVTMVSGAEGQSIANGTLLARIHDDTAADALRTAQVAVQSAQTAVAVAERDRERNTRLANAGALPKRDIDVSRQQVAAATAQLGQARGQLATARERSADQTVLATTDGIISQKSVSEGDVVNPGAPLFTIVDLRTLQIEASVSPDALSQIQPGTPVDVEVRGYPNEHFRGAITRIAPTVDAATGQVRVYVSINNQGRRLAGGLFAEGTITTASRMGLVIPVEALDESGAQPAVSRIRNGVVERVNVSIGIRNDAAGFVEILSGLAPGDRVLTGPARTIAAGTKVQIASGAGA